MEHDFLGGSRQKFLVEMEHLKGSPVFSVGMFHMQFCAPILWSYNLGQNLLRHITKTPIFFTHPDKNAYRSKLKDRFPPPLLQCCLGKHKKCTLELLGQNNIAPGVGRGANLFLLDKT